ncbi:MAG: hypothetical protein ACJ749_02040 [Flavisolibacter sp.]
MNNYLRNLFGYFENVLHPASGWSSSNAEKRKRKTRKGNSQASPESFNTRAASVKKQEKARMNPAP